MNKKCRVVPGSYSPGGNSRVSERGPGGVQVTQVFQQTPLKRNAMWSSCGCSEDGCSASALCVHCLRANSCAQDNARRRMKVEQARGETVRPSLETRARALGLKNKEELQRLQWATTKNVNRASRTEEQVEADKAKRRILDKERKDKYKATVSDLYDKSSRGCLEAKMQLAKAKYFGHFGLKINEFGAAFTLLEIHDRDEDAQDAVVADYQAERKRHFDSCFENDTFDYFSEEDEEFKKRAPIQNPRTLVAVLKAEAAQMLSSCDWLDPMIRNWVNKEEWRSKAVELNVTSAMVEEAHSLDDDSAWDKMRVDLLQRASKDHDGSSMTFFLEASREAQFELAEAYRYGRFGLGEDALKACAYYAKAGAPLNSYDEWLDSKGETCGGIEYYHLAIEVMETQWYLDSTGDGARGAAVEVASANRTPDFQVKAPDMTAKIVERKEFQESSNRVDADFRMRDRFQVRIQKALLTQSHEEFWTDYRSDISCHPFGSSRSMRYAEKADPEKGDADGVDESSDGSSNFSSNCSSESEDQEEDEDDFEAWW